MERVLESIYFITSAADPRISWDRMKADWDVMYRSVILPAYEKYPEEVESFVMEIHGYLKGVLEIGFDSDAWNIFMAITETSYRCSCLCGTLWILLACYSVGFFPTQVMGGALEFHAFVLDPTFSKFFETTWTCQTTWRSIHVSLRGFGLFLPYDHFLVLTSIEDLLSLYAMNMLILEGKTVPISMVYELLERYPDPFSPAYLRRQLIVGIQQNAPFEYLQDVLDRFWDVLETQKLLISFLEYVEYLLDVLALLRARFSEHREALFLRTQKIELALDQAYQRNYAVKTFRQTAAGRTDRFSLELFNLGLSQIPPEIGRFTSLRKLDLRFNDLSSLPSEIEQGTLLQELDLTHNLFRTFPIELTRLPELKLLLFTANQLLFLPPEIGLLSNLETLGLSNNSLTALPPEIALLSSLKQLYVSQNLLQEVPPEIGALTRLKNLSLFHNSLTTLPPEIGTLSSLTILDVSQNLLTSFPSEIRFLTQLKRLDLEGNPFPQAFRYEPPSAQDLADLPPSFL